jgi:Carboxypeptidase regulatory-like domain
MKRLIVGLAAVVAAACSGASTTAPSSTATPPPVTAATFALNGTVTSTTGTAVRGATLRIVDGSNAGRSTTVSSTGAYSLTGLSVSGMTVNATATNFFALSKGVTLTSSQRVDV